MPAHNLWETVPQHLLLGVDGIVFVVDTRLSKLFDNETQLQRLEALVRTTGRSLWDIPMVDQYNHRRTRCRSNSYVDVGLFTRTLG